MPEVTRLQDPVRSVLQFISTGGAFFTTWLLRVIFLDQKRYMWMWLVSGAVACLGLLVRHHVPGIGPFLRTFAALHFLALVALFVYPARDDLHIARRRIRPTLAVVFGLYSFAMALTLYAKGDLNPVSHALGQSVAFLFVVKILVIWMLKVTIGQAKQSLQLCRPSFSSLKNKARRSKVSKPK